MTGARMKFTLRDAALKAELRKRLKKLEDTHEIFENVGDGMLGRIAKRFKNETGPDGEKWAALSPVTIAARLKKKEGDPLSILRMQGHLAGSINYQVSAGVLKIGTNDDVEDYAAIHQFGGKAGRGKKVKIPARPYLGFSDEDMDIIEEEITEAVFGSEF